MNCSPKDNMELFVARVKVRIVKLLDGRKKSNDKPLDLLKYVGYLSNIDVTLEILNKTKIIDTLKLLEHINDDIRIAVSELLHSWKQTLGQNLSSGLAKDTQLTNDDIYPASFNEQLSESIRTNLHKKTNDNLCYSHPIRCKLNSLSEIEPPIVDLNIGCTLTLPQLKQIPSLPDILLPETSIDNVNNLITNQRRSVKRIRCPSNSINQFISRNTKRKKLYAGKIIISSLHELCIRKIVSNVLLVSKLPCNRFRIFKPILDRITPQELNRIELLNQEIIPFTESIWKRNCQKTFRDIIQLKTGESWRNKYILMQTEKEEKLKLVSCRISSKQSCKKPFNMMKSISLVKCPKSRKTINPNKNAKHFFNNDVESKKQAPLMKRTIMEFKERKQISKSKPIKFF